MGRNFINDAIMGCYISDNIGHIGQFEFWDDFMEWWNNLGDIVKYGIIAGVGLIAVVLVISMLKPANAGLKGVAQLEELLRLKMMKELAED